MVEIRDNGRQETNETQNDIWEKVRQAIDDGFQTVTLHACTVEKESYQANVIAVKTET